MDYGHRITDEQLKQLEAKIKREYDAAYKELKEKADKYFRKFEADDIGKRKAFERGEITKKQYIEWRQDRITQHKHFKDLCEILAKDMVNVDKIAVAIIGDRLPDTYATNYNYGTYEIESQTNIDTSFELYDHDTVERLLREDPDVIPQPSLDIPKDLRWNKNKITSALTQGILQGDSIPHIARRLKSVTDMDSKAAIRNARTYTTAAENGGRVDSYKRAKEMGIELQQKWQATYDSRTRTSHRHLDGEIRNVGEKFSNGCRYPGDPEAAPAEIYNCRCTLVGVIKDFPRDTAWKYALDIEGMSYNEWKKAK